MKKRFTIEVYNDGARWTVHVEQHIQEPKTLRECKPVFMNAWAGEDLAVLLESAGLYVLAHSWPELTSPAWLEVGCPDCKIAHCFTRSVHRRDLFECLKCGGVFRDSDGAPIRVEGRS